MHSVVLKHFFSNTKHILNFYIHTPNISISSKVTIKLFEPPVRVLLNILGNCLKTTAFY